MRSLSLLAAALALATSLTARAEPVTLIPGLSLTGHARYRIEADEFQDFANLRSFSTIRIRPNFSYQADDATRIVFEPQFVKIMGEQVLAARTNTTNANLATSGATYDTPVGFHQGFLEYRPNSTLQFTLGRQIIAYGEEIVFGAADWGVVGRSFDAVKTRLSYGHGYSDFIVAKLVDTNPFTSGPGDSTLFAVYNSQDFGPFLKAADLYALAVRNATVDPHADVHALGFRIKSGLEDLSENETGLRHALRHIDYRLEATIENGGAAGLGVSAYQADAEIGYTLTGASKFRVGFNAETAGRNYNQLYAAPHRWYGYADLFGRRNVTDYSIRVSSRVVGELSAQVDLHSFSRTSDRAPAYRTDGTTPLGDKSPSPSTDLGSELDLTLRYKLSRVLTATAGGSLVKPGEFLRGQYGNRAPKFYYFSAEAKF